jgi:hypothetical protein
LEERLIDELLADARRALLENFASRYVPAFGPLWRGDLEHVDEKRRIAISRRDFGTRDGLSAACAHHVDSGADRPR